MTTLNKVAQSVAVVVEGEEVLFQGTISYVDGEMKDLERKYIPETYGYALLVDLVTVTISNFELNVDAPKAITSSVLRNQKIREALMEFNQNFCQGLAIGDSTIKGDTAYYVITKEDSEVHKDALIATLQEANLIDKYTAIITKKVKEILDLEEANKEETQVKEEMVTITMAEYNSLKAIESINDTNISLLDQLDAKVKQYEQMIIELEKQCSEKDAVIELQKKQIADVQQNTNTKEDINMSTFKLTVDSFKTVEARATKEDKVVTTASIEGLDVGAIIKARVKTIEATKGVNQKIREKSPEAIVKVANATHTGIDAVAVAAHKTTNAVAKVTNTTIQKSANAVDAVLDFIAPSTSTVDITAYNRSKAEANEGDLVQINGHTYKKENGKLVVL